MATKVTHAPCYEEQVRTNDILEAISGGVAAMAAGSATPEFIDRTFEAILDGATNTSRVFGQWLATARATEEDDYKLLERWFTMLSRVIADKVYTVRGYAASASPDSAMTPLDDLAPLGKAALATDTNDGGADWAEEHPLTWYVRFNGISKSDGTMDIKAIEGDPEFDVTGELAPVYTASMALWRKETRDNSYTYKSWSSVRKAGFRPYAGDVDATGKKRPLTWHPTFGGGLTKDGTKLTSGAGTKPATYKSAIEGNTLAKKWGTHEGLWNDCDAYWLLDMWQLRHQSKENSGTLDGCTSYNYQYKAAKAEEGATRVLLAESNGANIIVGSVVSVGTPGGNNNIDRGQASMYSTANQVTVTSKANVVLDGATYTAINLDVPSPITVTADHYISTMPWTPGNTEGVPGHKDGCLGSLTDGKHPCRIAGVEILDGAYTNSLEPLWNVVAGSDGTHFVYQIFEQRDPTKLASTTAGYTDTGIRSIELTGNQWSYPKEFIENDRDLLFLSEIGGTASSYYRSGFYCSPAAGVRAPWRYGGLNYGVYGGLACAYGNGAPSIATWDGRPRLSGSGKSRGEWAG